jgi:hypothetical protein
MEFTVHLDTTLAEGFHVGNRKHHGQDRDGSKDIGLGESLDCAGESDGARFSAKHRNHQDGRSGLGHDSCHHHAGSLEVPQTTSVPKTDKDRKHESTT